MQAQFFQTLRPIALPKAFHPLRTPGFILLGLVALLWFAAPQVGNASLLLRTAAIALSTATLALIFGVAAAWVISRCRFKGRLVLAVLLALPLTLPSIVVGYVWVALYDYGGVAQHLLQTLLQTFGITITHLDVRNTASLVLVYAIIFYPYVYLASLAGFASISPASREAAASLGQSPAQTLRRVELPQVMPYAIGGALLVVCETVSDYGVAALFATETFSTWAVNHWTHTGDLRTALIVGGLVAVGVLALFALYPVAARPTFTKPLRAPQPARFSLRTGQLMLVYATLGLLMLLAVVAPLLQLTLWSAETLLTSTSSASDILPWSELAGITSSTVLLGISAAVFAVLLAMLLAEVVHKSPARWRVVLDFSYAVPAVVVGLACVWLFTQVFGIAASSLAVMLCALVLRFFPVAQRILIPARAAVSRSSLEAAASLGKGKFARLWLVGVPAMHRAILLSLLIVAVEVVKDIPITLLTRVPELQTLSLLVFEFAQESWWREAAVPALILTLLSLAAGCVNIVRATRG